MEDLSSVENFFTQIMGFLKQNATGDVSCLCLTSTSNGQFWINGMVDSKVWELGMIDVAETIMKAGLALQVQVMHEQAAELEKLKTANIPGKAN